MNNSNEKHADEQKPITQSKTNTTHPLQHNDKRRKLLNEIVQHQTRSDELNLHLELVLDAAKLKLEDERAMADYIFALSKTITDLKSELASKHASLDKLRSEVQQEVAAALYPIVIYELRDLLLGRDSIGLQGDRFVINQVLSDRLARHLWELKSQQ